MLEKKLKKVLEKAKQIRQHAIENGSANYYDDRFTELRFFIEKNLNSRLFKNIRSRIIVNHLDEILPYIVESNKIILYSHLNLLIEQPNFKEKFIDGLKKYPYKEGFDKLFLSIWYGLNNGSKFVDFIDSSILEIISTTMSIPSFTITLNELNEENQKKFLNLLVENKCDIPYLLIEYKGNNKQIIYDNLHLFMKNEQNLYQLMNFVKNNPIALSQVKDYIDSNEERAIKSIFLEANLAIIEDPTLKEMIKLILLEVMKNENVKFSEITYNDSGAFSSVILCGDKVIKLGKKYTKKFPNNPYIIAPLLRQELKFNNESCFVEITERVDTSTEPSKEELYQLFKNLRNLNLVWTDVKGNNVGRLKRENLIHWKEDLSPIEDVLNLDKRRGEIILQKGDLVILDADFIYDENDPNIIYPNYTLYNEFEDRYQKEKNKLLERKTIMDQTIIEQPVILDDDIEDEKQDGRSL